MNIAIIVGTSRPNRVSPKVAGWVQKYAEEHFETTVLDLADFNLPIFDEVAPPQYNPERSPSEPVQKWLEALSEVDGYIFVTAEYNHSVPAVLKNAIDYIDFQLAKKPVAIVAHGVVGGARAAEQLKSILGTLKASLVADDVTLMASGSIGDDFELEESVKANPYGPQGSLSAMLVSLKWYAEALKVAREK